jgi:molybdopterin biosynthesis enzyme
MLAGLSRANALVVVPEDVTEVKPGEAVAVLRLDEG